MLLLQLGCNNGVPTAVKTPKFRHCLFIFSLQRLQSYPHRSYLGRKMKTKDYKSKRTYLSGEQCELKWVHFCDFQEITHIVVKDYKVSIHRQDNKCLVGGSHSSPNVAISVYMVRDGDGFKSNICRHIKVSFV